MPTESCDSDFLLLIKKVNSSRNILESESISGEKNIIGFLLEKIQAVPFFLVFKAVL